MRTLMSILLLLPPATAGAADCVQEIDSEALEDVLSNAEAGFASGDHDTFRAALEEVAFFVTPCLVEPVDPDVAAHLHRVQALEHFIDDEEDQAFAALDASRALQPGGSYPSSVLPEGHTLRSRLAGLPRTGEDTRRLPRPRQGRIWLDGVDTRRVNPERPTLLQLADPEGRVTLSTYLRPGQPPPDYERKPVLRNILAITAGSAAAAFGGLYGGGAAVRQQYFQADPGDDATLDRLRTTANGLSATGVAMGAVAVGAGIGAIVVTLR